MSPLGAVDAAGTTRKRLAMPRARAVAVASCAALASALAAAAASADGARAPTKIECAQANADGQALRNDGKLAAARAQLEMCQAEGCPGIVRDDCAQRLDEIERAQPTIVFDVKDAAGADVSGAAVTLDGAPLSGRLTGGALRVDPGEHTFTITATGQQPVTRHLVIKEGEKDRRELVALSPASTAPPPPSPSSPAADTVGAGLGTRRLLGITGAGLGVASLAVGSVFGAMTFAAVSQQKNDCSSSTACQSPAQAESAHSRAVTDSTLSTVAFIAAGALIAGGAVLFFTAPPSTASRESAGWLVAPGVGPSGGALTFVGTF